MLRRIALGGAGAGVAGYVAYQLSPGSSEDYGGVPKKRGISRFNSMVDRGQNPEGLPSRAQQVAALKSGDQFDMIIVGSGCTGAGAALDARTRGLKVACIERGDFSNETSSRSSKLIWGGFKYLQVAFAELLSTATLKAPVSSASKFWGEFMMVWECCQERSWLAGFQPHLVHYVPQAVPFQDWIKWPPYFDHPFYAILPLLAVPAFWFYDALAGFHAPSSHAMGPTKTKEVFPQLQPVKYSAVYCEAMHNDARTGTAIALTAALKGATMANYVEMIDFVHGGPDGATCTGIKCRDNLSGEVFEVKASAVVLATGAFLDAVRKMDDPNAPSSVRAAAGCHIVLPGYFTPGGMGFAELRTSRGATMYFLPWLGHTIVGSTDKKCPPKSSPAVSEDEIQYLVNEAASCLSKDISIRRSDVLSAWQGWRPLYRDPNAPPDAPISRHHAIGTDPKSGVTFICGGKWSTYRAMAEELIDKVVAHKQLPAGPCVTKQTKLLGGEGYHDLLHVQLIQKYGLDTEIAHHLATTYGSSAFKVCEMCKPTGKRWPRFGKRIIDGYPFIEEEVEYAAKYEYAVSVKDMVSLRMRIAYLNSTAAREAVPRVTKLMAEQLGWSKKEAKRQEAEAMSYLGEFGGPVKNKSGARLRAATFTDLNTAFEKIDTDGNGYINEEELEKAAIELGFPFRSAEDRQRAFKAIDQDDKGKISSESFVEWWNTKDESSKRIHQQLSLTATSEVALDKMFEDEKKAAKGKK